VVSGKTSQVAGMNEIMNNLIGNDNYLDKRKMSTENTIEDLKNSKKYKLRDVVEVLGFYAKGDGSHHKRIAKDKDDGSGEQGQNGIWWCIVHSGEVNVSWFGADIEYFDDFFEKYKNVCNKLFFPSGEYKFKNTININRNNLTLIGEDKNTIFYFEHTSHGIVINNCDDLTLDNISITYKFKMDDYQQSYGKAIFFDKGTCNDLTIKNCLFYDCPTQVIALWGSVYSKNILITNCISKMSGREFVFINYKENVIVENCYIEDTGDDGIALHNGCKNSRAINNTIIRAGSSRLTAGARGIVLSGDSNSAIGNTLIDCVDGVGFSFGANNCIFEGNVMKGLYTDGDKFRRGMISAALANGTNKVTNNIFDLSTATAVSGQSEKMFAIKVQYTSESVGTSQDIGTLDISNNTFVMSTDTNITPSALLFRLNVPRFENIIIKNNIFKNCSQQDFMYAQDSVKIGRTVIEGNIFTDIDNNIHKFRYFVNLAGADKETIGGSVTIKNNDLILDSSVQNAHLHQQNVQLDYVDVYQKEDPVIRGVTNSTIYKLNNGSITNFKYNYTNYPDRDLYKGKQFYNVTNNRFFLYDGESWNLVWDLASLASLDTPYYTLKMQQEGIYEDYVAYRDELHEYENSQVADETMFLPVLHEPEIPESVKLFAEKYKLI
ncbi:MAG: right-handed parallel beta-helix repeat-containing protein, partial [Cetobacterium sp.]